MGVEFKKNTQKILLLGFWIKNAVKVRHFEYLVYISRCGQKGTGSKVTSCKAYMYSATSALHTVQNMASSVSKGRDHIEATVDSLSPYQFAESGLKGSAGKVVSVRPRYYQAQTYM